MTGTMTIHLAAITVADEALTRIEELAAGDHYAERLVMLLTAAKLRVAGEQAGDGGGDAAAPAPDYDLMRAELAELRDGLLALSNRIEGVARLANGRGEPA
jgi:hypothetical protein